MNEFKCNKCGACCKHVDLNEESSFLDRGDGVCKYYDEKNMCQIYDFRPEICRVEKMYKKFKNQMTYEEYIKASYEACENLREFDKKINEEEILILE